MKVKLTNLIASSLKEKLTASMTNKVVSDGELRSRVTSSTINYFGSSADGIDVVFDKNTA